MSYPLTVEVVTPQRLAISEPVASIILPGALGEMQILPGHRALLAELHPGRLVAESVHGQIIFSVGSGFVEVLEDKVTVLVVSAENVTEIDIERARASAKLAADRLGELDTEQVEENFLLQEALERAKARIAVWESYRGKHDDE